jgi:hypothetical protein
VSRFEPGTPNFKSHALTTRQPRLLLLEMFSAAGRKHRATDCLNLCPKCTETRLRASASSKNFPGVIPPDPRFKGEGRQKWGWVWKDGNGKESSGVVEGGCGGMASPQIFWKGDGIPQIIRCQGGCNSCSIPPNQVSCYQIYKHKAIYNYKTPPYLT